MLHGVTVSRICLFSAWICLLPNASGRGNDSEDENFICTDKKYLDRCLSKLPRFVDQSLMRRMPVSKTEIESLCRFLPPGISPYLDPAISCTRACPEESKDVLQMSAEYMNMGFEIGMQCISGYSSKCLDEDGKHFLETQVSGARKVFNALCNDESFRAEYLQHTICLKGTQKNWETCVNRFTHLVQEEINSKNYSREARMFHTCCAIHGFSRCIYVPGRMKCQKKAAIFLLKIADMSIDQKDYARYCRSVTNDRVCSGSSKIGPGILLIFHLFLELLYKWCP